ncbi:MAG TPA: response regulator [Myxococcota bacterium]|nr:response regulator [Myxococcota bacterium]
MDEPTRAEGDDDRLNILLVDDQPGKLLTYETILAELGENLVKATSARTALAHLLRDDFAIVVMDVSMPDVDGFELASMIRQHPRCQKTAIIFVSAVHLSDLDRLKGYETGAVDYLQVPVVPEMLRAKIRVLADLHRKTNRLTRWNAELERRVEERTRELEASAARLRESEERFRSLSERMPHLVWESDAEGRVSYHNPRWYDYTGAPAEESLGERWLDYFHPDDREFALSEWRKAIATGGEYGLDIEVRLRREDGVYRWFRLTGEPVPDASGAVGKWVGTCTDVEERKRAEEGLREADRRKDEFLAMLAHELRNPLAPIRNTVKLLRQTGRSDGVSEWGRDVIERQVEQLTRLVDDLLDVSRITRGKIQLQLEPLDLATVVAGAVETSRPMIDTHRHTLHVELPRRPVPVLGDLVRLTQVVSNLLNNAAKFQEDGGEITVTAERQDDRAVIRVRDRGVGIAPEMLGKVFDLFAQVERSVARSEGGLGIGLSLVKSLVELHGGRIQASSAGRGRGAEFCVSLPCSVQRQRVPASESAAAPGSDAPLASALPVLIVDDNRDAAESLAMVLRLRGYDTTVCHDGQEAVEVAQRRQPRIVLLDLGLPGLDGFEVCRRLREHGLDKVYIVAITGYGQDDDRRRSREAGFDEHLVKPVDPDALMRRLEAVMSSGDPIH